MRNSASYQMQEATHDPANDLSKMDWNRNWEIVVAEAASILNDALSEEYGDLTEFHRRMSVYGFAESATAGAVVRELLENVPNESKAEILAKSLDHANISNEGVILAYRREYYELDKLSWPEPEPATEHSILEMTGTQAYQQILLAREILKRAAYLCATPGEFGPKKEAHFLDATRKAYQHTICENGETPQQALEHIDLAYRRLSYVARNHLESVLDHIPPEYPAADEIDFIIRKLDQTKTIHGADLFRHTAKALSDTLAIDGTIPNEDQAKLHDLAEIAQQCQYITGQWETDTDSTQYRNLDGTEIIEKIGYDAIANLRKMGYRNEREVIEDMASDDWNRVCHGLEAIDTAAPQQYSSMVAHYILSMTEKSKGHDTASARYRHLEGILKAGSGTAAYTSRAADAMEKLQNAGAPELAIKLDQTMRNSLQCNLLRMAPNIQYPPHSQMFPSERHFHYDDLISKIPEVIKDIALIPGHESTPYTERATHEVNRMGYRLLSEVKERLLEQIRGNGQLVQLAYQNWLSEPTTERIREFQEKATQASDARLYILPSQQYIEEATAMVGVTLALQKCMTTNDEEKTMRLLDLVENDQAAAKEEAAEMLHPMIQAALGSARETAASWSEAEMLDGQTTYEVSYADLQFIETDGGRNKWLQESGEHLNREKYAGDCTVRALAVATGQTQEYGKLWEEITETVKHTGKDADDGARPIDFHDTYAAHGMMHVYIDSQLPSGYAQREIDIREIQEAMSHLFDDTENPLIYIVNTYNHNVTVVNGTLMDDRDTRQIGEDNTYGRVHNLWVKCDDPELLQRAREDFARYARVRAHSAA